MFLTWLVFAFGAFAAAANVFLAYGQLVLTIGTDRNREKSLLHKRLVYKVSFRGKQLIEESALRS